MVWPVRAMHDGTVGACTCYHHDDIVDICFALVGKLIDDMMSPYEHELNGAGTACADDCPACKWAAEKREQEQRDYAERYEYAAQHPDEFPHPEFHPRYGRNVGKRQMRQVGRTCKTKVT